MQIAAAQPASTLLAGHYPSEVPVDLLLAVFFGLSRGGCGRAALRGPCCRSGGRCAGATGAGAGTSKEESGHVSPVPLSLVGAGWGGVVVRTSQHALAISGFRPGACLPRFVCVCVFLAWATACPAEVIHPMTSPLQLVVTICWEDCVSHCFVFFSKTFARCAWQATYPDSSFFLSYADEHGYPCHCSIS